MKAKAKVFCHAKHHRQLSKEIADKEGAEGMCFNIIYFCGKESFAFSVFIFLLNRGLFTIFFLPYWELTLVFEEACYNYF